MPAPSLSSCIVRSLKLREMVRELPEALLSKNRTEAIRHNETEYWDYKVQLNLENPIEAAKLARNILGFHNAKGGVLIVGIDDSYHAVGIAESMVLDTNKFQSKIRKYIGPNISVFQDTVAVPNSRFLWLLFVPKREGAPVPVYANGPQDERARPVIRRDDYYIRVDDQVKLCVEPNDFQRLFTNVSMDHIHAYLYDVDEPYCRLLAPHCDQFVGRVESLQKVGEALERRHPIVALDGVGGVGKSAIAIELMRHLYDAQKFMFIVSLSAKSRVWHEHTDTRRAGFSGLTEYLRETAKVLQLPLHDDLDRLKQTVIEFMQDVQGLLLVDNIEDIRDDAVLTFLSTEVPAPVKVLVTSRIDRGLGPLTISIPEMNEFEAKTLLINELQRVGYIGYYSEQAQIDEVLAVTGKLPLALKWAAILAANLGSLKEASSRIRRQDSTKKEFLNFCFATMYEVLSPLARDVALLCPYLRQEWNVAAVSVALDRSESDIRAAVDELKDKGIVMASSTTREGALSLLPLTIDFLSHKWHENSTFRRQVLNRLTDAIASPEVEGILLNWPLEQRVKILQQRAEMLRDSGDLKAALRLVRLALSWSPNPQLQFLEGRIRYESGDRMDGLSYMHVALNEAQDSTLMNENKLFYAEALRKSGGNKGARDALKLMEEALPHSKSANQELIETFCRLALDLREYGSLAKVISKTENPSQLYCLVKALSPHFDDSMVIHHSGQSIVHALRKAATASEITNEEKSQFQLWAAAIESKVPKLKLFHQANADT